ncbi:MAG: P22 phage major capsid protein family protein [Solirubrobacteraceae bacterium]
MANTFITPDVIAASALATLYNTIVLAGLVARDYDAEFTGDVGDTVRVRTPATFVVDEYVRADGLTVQDVTEGSLNVVLDTILDVSFALTAEQQTLDIQDVETRVIAPAMEALAQDIDKRLADTLVDQARASHAGKPVTGAYLATASSTVSKAWRDSRSILSRNKLPMGNRVAVYSPEAVSSILGDSLFVTANESGSTQGLTEAALGRKFGFDNYESQTLGYGSGSSGRADGVAFHRSAVALVMRTLALPRGASSEVASAQGYKGLGLRVVWQYDQDQKKDVCSVDALIGVQDIRSEAAVEITFGQGS